MGIVNGAEAILEGFGRKPPPAEVSQNRADICTGRLSGLCCPNNYRGGWAVSTRVAQVINAQRERKLQLKLHVEGEEKLGTCTVCKCPLTLKVFYDEETIYGHTTDEDFAKFAKAYPPCWMNQINNKYTHK